MGRPTVRPPAAAAPRAVAAIRPPYPPVTTVQPCAASRPPRRPAASCRGSPGAMRADPTTAISTGPPPGALGRDEPGSVGDELVATDALLRRQVDDDTAARPRCTHCP